MYDEVELCSDPLSSAIPNQVNVGEVGEGKLPLPALAHWHTVLPLSITTKCADASGSMFTIIR